MEVEGLAYRAGQDVQNKRKGYIVFMRNERNEGGKTNDQANHEKYRNDVFVPFAQGTREHFLGKQGCEKDGPIEDNELWVSWMD